MISDVYFPRVNGVSTSISTYRDSLLELGHEVTLLAPAYPAGHPPEHWIWRMPSRGVWRDPEDRMMHFRPLVALAGELRTRDYDIVHIQTPFVAHYAGLRLARLLGLPALATYHTYFEEYLDCYIPLRPRALLRTLARSFSASQGNAVNALVAPSRAMQEKLAGYGVTTPMRVIPTGIDLRQFSSGDGRRFRDRIGIDPARPMLLFTGRVAFEKNIDFLLEVTARIRTRIPDILLVITGEGPAERHLRALAARLGITDNVTFVGYLDRKSGLLDCYAAADVFVFSSRTETQGLVLLEAMAMGLPVVAHALMGTRDVLRDGMGALVAADRDHEDFSAKVLHLLNNRRARREQQARAREYAQSWSNEHCAHRLAEYYAETIEQHDQPPAGRRRPVREHAAS